MSLPEAVVVDNRDGGPDPHGAVARLAAEFGLDVGRRVEVEMGGNPAAAEDVAMELVDEDTAVAILNADRGAVDLAGVRDQAPASVDVYTRRALVRSGLRAEFADARPRFVDVAGVVNAGKTSLIRALGGEPFVAPGTHVVTTLDGVDDLVVHEETGRRSLDGISVFSAPDGPHRDVLVLAVDISQPVADARADFTELFVHLADARTLAPIVIAATKVDLLSEKERERRLRALAGGLGARPSPVPVSAESGDGVDELKARIDELAERRAELGDD